MKNEKFIVMKTNQFNIKRFWQLFCLHCESNKKNILLILSLTFLTMVVILLVTTLLFSVPKSLSETLPLAQEGIVALSALSNASWVVILVGFVFVCNVFANMSSRSGEIHYLTLPAMNSEKWLSRVLFAVVFGVVLIYVVQQLAVLVCVAIGWIFDVESMKMLKDMAFAGTTLQAALKDFLPASFFAEVAWVNRATTFFIVVVLLLGGTVFRRLPWLYTALVLFGSIVVIYIAFIFGIQWYFRTNEEAFVELMQHFTSMNGGFANYVIDRYLHPIMRIWTVVAPILGVLMLWLSYRLFCRRQLTCQKIKYMR